MLLTVIVFLLVLSILVLIHEAGHYFVAKKFGIKVEEFGFGFPPRAFGIKRGETVYSINWLPIGGFVKLYGEDDAGGGKIASIKNKEENIKGKDRERAFFARSVSQRALVVVAGVVMNAILAVILYYMFFALSNFHAEIPLIGNHIFFGATQKNVNIDPNETYITVVSKDSPADKAGILPHVKVLALDNQPVTNRSDMIKTINGDKGKTVTLTLQDLHTNQTSVVAVTPRVNPPKGEGPLGIGFFPAALLSYDSPMQKVLSGIVHPVNLLIYNFDVMGKLIGISFQQRSVSAVSEGVSGPVGIGRVVGDILSITDKKELIMQLLNLAGVLSISLAFFNVLPIPALDGGRLFFILIEGVTKKKVNPKFEEYAHTIGMVVLLGLILLITFKDILQLLPSAGR